MEKKIEKAIKKNIAPSNSMTPRTSLSSAPSPGLDAQHVNHLDQVVADRARRVHIRVAEHLEQVDPLGVEHPLRLLGVAALRRRVGHEALGLADEDLFDVGHALERDLGEQRALDLLEKGCLEVFFSGGGGAVENGRGFRFGERPLQRLT